MPDTSSIRGTTGADILYGDNGSAAGPSSVAVDDFLYGGRGNDTIYGFYGDDHIYGGNDNDNLYGGSGNDIISGEAGNDYLSGGAGDDILSGGIGNDTLSGGDGNDYVAGGADDDILGGGAGNDTVSGGAGNDRLNGNDGDDIIISGTGLDTLTGGAGADTFVFSATDSGLGVGSRDQITDFTHGVDEIDLTRIVGLTAADVTLTDVIKSSGVSSGHTIVGVDTDHDGHANFEVDVHGIVSLSDVIFA